MYKTASFSNLGPESNDFTNEYEFEGKLNRFLFKLSQKGDISICIPELIGCRDTNNEAVTI